MVVVNALNLTSERWRCCLSTAMMSSQPRLQHLHWLPIHVCIDYKIATLTCQVITFNQLPYLHYLVLPEFSIRQTNVCCLSLQLHHNRPLRIQLCSTFSMEWNFPADLQYFFLCLLWKAGPLSSDRQYLSYGVYLEVRGEIIRTVLYCIVYGSFAQL